MGYLGRVFEIFVFKKRTNPLFQRSKNLVPTFRILRSLFQFTKKVHAPSFNYREEILVPLFNFRNGPSPTFPPLQIPFKTPF